ncbi:MAG: PmoA family protein [Aureliella sp.]
MRVPVLAALICLQLLLLPDVYADELISLRREKDRVVVSIGDNLFTQYIFDGYEKPILYPVIGPTGSKMTRDYPMKQDAPNEADDHPHHKSIWFGHMKVNNESFWHTGSDAGTTQMTSLEVIGKSIHTKNDLVDRNGELVATDSRIISFGTENAVRWIDYQVTYHASESDLTFGDNKDGQMGIRMHPALRIKGPIANGQAINAAGVREKEIWGKRAPWIDYWGKVDGQIVGIAVFDHPTNLRHPTWWHARDYGLLSANPFGIHHFENLEDSAAGEYQIPKGASLIFKHRFVFHKNDPETAGISDQYQSWASQ